VSFLTTNSRHGVARFHRGAIRVLARLGIVQVIVLSRKGRLTQFTERLEPFVRRKLVRKKWFPPLIIAINPVDSPNPELEKYFSRRVCFVHHDDHRRRIQWIRLGSENSPDTPLGPLKKVKRPGSPWEMTPSVTRRDDWSIETGRLLDRMGVDQSKPVVLLAVRDAAYYDALRKTKGMEGGPETSTDTYIRNPDLATYSTAVSRLNEMGCVVVRFGSEMSALPSELQGRVIDYAGNHRTPRGDLLLGRYCTMMVSGAAGAWVLASLFNHPVAMSNNYMPFMSGVSQRDRQIPQLLWSRKEQRLLTFREMVLTEGKYSYASNCLRDEIDLVKNTPEELADHAEEVLLRLKGRYPESAEDNELLNRFWEVQKLSPPPVHMRSPIALSFLRRHRDLLR